MREGEGRGERGGEGKGREVVRRGGGRRNSNVKGREWQ